MSRRLPGAKELLSRPSADPFQAYLEPRLYFVLDSRPAPTESRVVHRKNRRLVLERFAERDRKKEKEEECLLPPRGALTQFGDDATVLVALLRDDLREALLLPGFEGQ
ncbi:hypothetical protein KM043_016346 [Ampulex compressa]|nr:hypothetical protein KM043_016346 [Ampulex compressa]